MWWPKKILPPNSSNHNVIDFKKQLQPELNQHCTLESHLYRTQWCEPKDWSRLTKKLMKRYCSGWEKRGGVAKRQGDSQGRMWPGDPTITVVWEYFAVIREHSYSVHLKAEREREKVRERLKGHFAYKFHYDSHSSEKLRWGGFDGPLRPIYTDTPLKVAK